MALTVRETNGVTSAYEDNVDTLSPNVPTGHEEGDKLVLVAMHDSGGDALPITGGGWDKHETGGATVMSAALYTRTATGSEPGSYEITCSTSGNFHAVIIALDPDGGTIDTIEAADSTTADTTSATSTSSSVTAAENGVLIVAFANDGNRTVDTAPDGTERYLHTGTSTAFGVYTQQALSAGGITDEMIWNASDEVEAQAITISATGGGAESKTGADTATLAEATSVDINEISLYTLEIVCDFV